jgi:hypothetical protein
VILDDKSKRIRELAESDIDDARLMQELSKLGLGFAERLAVARKYRPKFFSLAIVGALLFAIGIPIFIYTELIVDTHLEESLAGQLNIAESVKIPPQQATPLDTPLIPLALIHYELEKNELRAIRTFNNGRYEVVGVFRTAEELPFTGNIVGSRSLHLQLKPDANSIGFSYLPVTKQYEEFVIDLNRGDLVTANCEGLEIYGVSSRFKSCDFFEKTDTKGLRPDLYLDQLIAENNELLGNTPAIFR